MSTSYGRHQWEFFTKKSSYWIYIALIRYDLSNIEDCDIDI